MIKSTYGILPKYVFMISIVLITILIIYQIISKKQKTKQKIIELLKLIYIIAGVIFASIAPQFMQNTESIWFTSRSTYTYAAILGILVLYLFMNYECKKDIEYISILISMVILITQFFRFNVIESDRYKVNAIDYEITKNIAQKIDEYEEKTGNKITQIAIYQDKSPEFTYSGIFATGDINTKAYLSDWATNYILKYYFGKQLTIINADNEIQEQFENKDWNSFEEEQLIFKDDTLHLCRY